MRICVLGPIEIRTDVGEVVVPSGGKQRLLLATLVLHSPRIVSSDRLADVLWGEDLPDDPGASLRTQVSRLRASLARAEAEERLQRGDASGYGLVLRPGEVDAGVFEEVLTRTRLAAAPERGLTLAAEALAIWRDEAYGEFQDLSYFLGEIARLRELRLVARERLAECLLAVGRLDDALFAAEALVHHDPLRERPRALTMQALYRAGRRHDALASFQEYRRQLSAELGLDPSPALRALEAGILRHAGP